MVHTHGKASRPRMRAAFPVVLALLAILALAASASPASAATTIVKVGQINGGAAAERNFNAASITISAGDTVRWEWFDGAHDIQSGVGPSFSSGAKGGFNSAGQVFQYTFAAAGTYTYYCDEHAGPGDAELGNIDANIAGGKMVGKVVVTAPITDTTAPTVSGVAAAPNPTTGSGAVTLTATVTDNVGVSGAQWSRGVAAAAAGSGTAMAAIDGTFNSASVGVTATASISEAVGSTVILWVRGRDAAGNWSTAVSTSVSVTAAAGGSRSLSAKPITFPAVTLTGADRIVDGVTQSWRASDTTGTGGGWNVSITGSNFRGPSGAIPAANLSVRQLQAGITIASGNTAPLTQVPGYQPLSAAAPLKLLSASAGTGMGAYDFAPDFRLTIPVSTALGDYVAALVVTINSGP